MVVQCFVLVVFSESVGLVHVSELLTAILSVTDVIVVVILLVVFVEQVRGDRIWIETALIGKSLIELAHDLTKSGITGLALNPSSPFLNSRKVEEHQWCRPLSSCGGLYQVTHEPSE